MRKRSLIGIFATSVLVLLIAAVPPLLAQECTALIQQSFATLGEECTDIGSSSACFGSAASIDSGATFAEAGDTVGLSDFSSITTSALNEDEQSFGLAMLTVPANVPLSLSETGLRYVLVGDVTLENMVDPTTAVTPAQPITLTAIVGSNLRSAPSTDARVINSVAAGETLTAAGVSGDQEWFMVLFQDSNVWVSRQVVTVTEGDAATLPVMNNDQRSLMQSFKLTTGTGVPDCVGTPPSMLILQAPSGFNALIEINGVEVRFDDTVAFWMLPDGTMQMGVLAGGASSNTLNLPAGFTMVAPIGEDGMISGAWTGLRPISDGERVLISTVEGLPEAMLYTAISIPSAEEVQQTLASINQSAASGPARAEAGASISCDGFRPTSPLETMPNSTSAAFFWDGVEATSYRLNIYTEGGQLLRSFEVDALNTTFVTDTTALEGGPVFRWEVEALVNGQRACTTSQVLLVRDAVPVGVESGGDGGSRPTPTACPWSSC